MDRLNLYVHAPFCARRCLYCDFAVAVDRAPAPGPWLDAVESELAAVIEREGLGRPLLDTLYVGGGTPSVLGPGAMPELRERIGRSVDLARDAEWTVEANPESFDARLAADWRAAGVGRLSFGVQSFDPAALRWMGRLHGPEGPRRAIEAARAAGFDNIGVDLIFGLPERLGREWAADLDRALRLAPNHVSLYGLTAEPGTPLGSRVAAGDERLADEQTWAAEYLLAAKVLAAAGFRHYEVSNFALPGRESRHNSDCWAGRPYVGLGPGAHSYLPPRRWWNTRDWAAYRDRIERTGTALQDTEHLDGAALRLERAWLGLRTAQGTVADSAPQRRVAAEWEASGWARLTGDRVRLTAAGWLLLDHLAVEYAAA